MLFVPCSSERAIWACDASGRWSKCLVPVEMSRNFVLLLANDYCHFELCGFSRMSDKSPDADDQSLIVNHLIAEYLSRRKSGEKISIEDFVAAHPEHADELKHQLATSNASEALKTTGMADVDETIIGSGDATDQTVSRATSGSDTSVTQDFRQRNTGSATSIEISETFGRYTIQKVLGQGAMGAVYLAKDTQLDRDVALKIPKFGDGNGVDDKELLERFYREARASATIRSLNVCPVYDVGEIDGQHYITMAFIEGRPLKDYTQSKKSHSEKQIITTIRKLALGLAEAHKIGVVHRDLKPANIMVDLKGEPVVMDFGLARRSASDDVQVTQSGAIVGTPAYMSPEQIEGDQSVIGPQTDIYALGVIMYELITGKMPFSGTLITLISQIAANNPEKPSEIRKNLEPRLESICLKMMASDLSQRYQSMTEVANDLQNVLRNPGKQQKQNQAQKTGKKPTSIPSANEESNPALISIEQPKSYAEQLREKKKGKRSKSSTHTSKVGSSSSSPPKKKMLILGGVGGVLLLLGIFFLNRGDNDDVKIAQNDPTNTLTVDIKDIKGKQGESNAPVPAIAPFDEAKAKPKTSMTKVVSGNQIRLLEAKSSALSFNGGMDRVEIPSLKTPAGPFTLELWGRLGGDGGNVISMSDGNVFCNLWYGKFLEGFTYSVRGGLSKGARIEDERFLRECLKSRIEGFNGS